MAANKNFDEKLLLDYSWKYFELHAKQRMDVFDFYVVISALMVTGIGASLEPDHKMYVLSLLLGLSLSLISIVFWRLDLRVKTLIKNSENAMKRLENFFPSMGSESSPSPIQLFKFEAFTTSAKRAEQTGIRKIIPTSYSECFNTIYTIFGLIGLISAAMSGYFIQK